VVRPLIATGCIVAAVLATEPLKADPYRWCAQYNVSGGALNCYFGTLEQCRMAAAGMGNFCVPNTLYNGPAETGPVQKPARKRNNDH
jgi:uncharacterized protein DUF3551